MKHLQLIVLDAMKWPGCRRGSPSRSRWTATLTPCSSRAAHDPPSGASRRPRAGLGTRPSGETARALKGETKPVVVRSSSGG